MTQNPLTVAIETTGDICSVALFDGNRLRGEISLEVPRGHDRLLAEMVRQLLAATDIQGTDLKHIAVSVGPGSFTGIRIGLAFAIGLSLGSGGDIIPVPTLDAVAFAMRGPGHFGHRTRVLALVPAGRDELYAALYQVHPDFRRLTETKALPIRSIAALLDENVLAAGPGAAYLDTSCADSVVSESTRISAVHIGQHGLHLHYNGVGTAAEDVRPLYINDFVPVIRRPGGAVG